MELAVHRLRKTKLPRAESEDRNKIVREAARYSGSLAPSERSVRSRSAKVYCNRPRLRHRFVCQSRTMHPAFVYIRKNRGQGLREGDFSGLCPFDDAQISSETASEATRSGHAPVGNWSGQRRAGAADEGTGLAIRTAREPTSSYAPRAGKRSASAGHGALAGTEISAPATPASACRNDLEALSRRLADRLNGF
jgi:hypothetical protein